MRNLSIILLTLSLMCTLISCTAKGKVNNVVVTEIESNIYSEHEISSAIDTAIAYFRDNFKDCTLTEIEYAGDGTYKEASEWADQYKSEKVIILTSTFEVGPSGGDGSLDPDSTYSNWHWILAKNKSGKWEHKDHGYG